MPMMNTYSKYWKDIPVRQKLMVCMTMQIYGAKDLKLVTGKGVLGIDYEVQGLMDFPVEIDLPGKFSVYNSLTAIAICRHFGVSEEIFRKP